MTATETDRAYAAGFMDGEGSFMIMNRTRYNKDGTRKQYPYVVLSAASTDLGVIDWMTDRWPASRNEFRPPTDRLKKRYIATWTGSQAERLLWDVLPYLVIKQRQAMLAIACQDTMMPVGTNRLAPGMLDFRYSLRAEMQRLNRRGVAA